MTGSSEDKVVVIGKDTLAMEASITSAAMGYKTLFIQNSSSSLDSMTSSPPLCHSSCSRKASAAVDEMPEITVVSSDSVSSFIENEGQWEIRFTQESNIENTSVRAVILEPEQDHYPMKMAHHIPVMDNGPVRLLPVETGFDQEFYDSFEVVLFITRGIHETLEHPCHCNQSESDRIVVNELSKALSNEHVSSVVVLVHKEFNRSILLETDLQQNKKLSVVEGSTGKIIPSTKSATALCRDLATGRPMKLTADLILLNNLYGPYGQADVRFPLDLKTLRSDTGIPALLLSPLSVMERNSIHSYRELTCRFLQSLNQST